MKITLIGPVYPYRGGIAHYTTALSQKLIEAGHSVQMISFKRQYPAWLYPGQSDKDPSALHDEVPALYTLDPLYFWTWSRAAQQIHDFQPDLVIIQWWTTFWGPAYLFLSAILGSYRIPCFFCIHNVIPHEKRILDIWLSRAVLSRGKGFITLSPKESKRLAKLIPAARIHQSRLPVPRVIEPARDRDVLRAEMGFSDTQTVFLSFGIVRPYKGLHILIDALGRLRGENISPALIIAGEFWDDVQSYRDQIERHGLLRQVTIENRYVPNEELSRFFSIADAFVAPYLQGTQSAAIKMAMSYGLPVLASDQISGDLPVDSYPVCLHHAGDAEDLARSIRDFITAKPALTGSISGQDDWADIVALIERLRCSPPDGKQDSNPSGKR